MSEWKKIEEVMVFCFVRLVSIKLFLIFKIISEMCIELTRDLKF